MVHGLDTERTAPWLRAHHVDDPTTAGTSHPLLVATVLPGAALTVGSRQPEPIRRGIGRPRPSVLRSGPRAHDAFPADVVCCVG